MTDGGDCAIDFYDKLSCLFALRTSVLYQNGKMQNHANNATR